MLINEAMLLWKKINISGIYDRQQYHIYLYEYWYDTDTGYIGMPRTSRLSLLHCTVVRAYTGIFHLMASAYLSCWNFRAVSQKFYWVIKYEEVCMIKKYVLAILISSYLKLHVCKKDKIYFNLWLHFLSM